MKLHNLILASATALLAVPSIVALVGEGGKVVEENSYDAWGRMRDPDTHEVYRMDKVPSLTLGRGYGSHEYLHRFGLVNMNARLYDPVLGRFASPDPYVQDPTLPQNFNRYSYCLNNPLLYRDPSGEFFMTILTSAIELWSNVFTHGFNVNRYNWRRTENAWAIDTGMFRGNFGQVLQKMTWGILTTGLGNITAHGLNLLGKIDHVSYMDGMLALSGVTSGDKAFTIGYYSFGPKNYDATWMDHLFVHEYGHYIQSQFMGPLFLPVVALPSVLSAWKGTELFGIEHIRRWFEVNASHLGSLTLTIIMEGVNLDIIRTVKSILILKVSEPAVYLSMLILGQKKEMSINILQIVQNLHFGIC